MKKTENDIVKGCLANKRWAQEALYNTYGPKLMPVCMRYARFTHEAEDIMHMGFIKAFKYMHTFKGTGSLYGWLKTIFVNIAIQQYSQNKREQHINNFEDEAYYYTDNSVSALEKLKAEDVMKLVNELPDGYRIVFNLYVVEGYKHREIADLLSITEGTSKSQLAKAKQLLQAKLSTEHSYAINQKSTRISSHG